jgi:flagellar assembly protein FliH
MPLIKHTNADEILQDATVLDLGDLRRAAEQIIRKAQDKAQRIVADARVEAQRRAEEAEATGRAEGIEQGRMEGRAEVREELLEALRERLEGLTAGWTEALERWEKDRRELLLTGTEDVLAFAVALGEKVVHRVIEADPTVVREQMTEALALVSRPGAVDVCINPDDRDEVDRMIPALLHQIAGCEHVGVREDPSIGRGGCVVRTRGGSIDATVESQLERIAETLLPGDGVPAAAPGVVQDGGPPDNASRTDDGAAAPDESAP